MPSSVDTSLLIVVNLISITISFPLDVGWSHVELFINLKTFCGFRTVANHIVNNMASMVYVLPDLIIVNSECLQDVHTKAYL